MSFEFFPPDNEAGAERLDQAMNALMPFGPAFTSLTYGAGGSDRQKSLKSLTHIVEKTRAPVAAHLTCVGVSVDRIEQTLDDFLNIGIRHFVALRGDLPSGTDKAVLQASGYRRADQLVAAIRRRGDFDISVATYPEGHPESSSIKQDITALMCKQDAGANRAITQFFYDTDQFLRFRDEAFRAGVRIPIVPGILPVHHFGNTCRFAQRCGTTIPDWMRELFDGLDDAPDVRSMVATTVATEQCARLIEHGVDHFHFYTLNRDDLTSAICYILGLGTHILDTGETDGAQFEKRA